MTNLPNIILKPGRDKSARQYHPWIYSGAIGQIDGNPGQGDLVKVLDDKYDFLAYGYYNQASQIALRLLEWNENNIVNETWWHDKISQSIARRKLLADDTETNAYRLVFGESDMLPGLIVDRYADFIATQFLTAGIEKVRPVIIAALQELIQPIGIFDRSDVEIRGLDGLLPVTGCVAGIQPPQSLRIKEHGFSFNVDIATGQKTGFYLDQRDNRKTVSEFAPSRQILDCFSYTGAFSIYAMAIGAEKVTLVDSSANSLDSSRQNIALNGLDKKSVEFVQADVAKYLRDLRNAGRTFDMVILDPPKFASSQTHLKKALAGYKDINFLALSLLRADGILATFSCSGAVSLETMKTVLFWAATDAGRKVQIIQTLSQGMDHPILVSFPESEYLKGLICRVI
jgi:23S rRNA (cytosine1962-C5)-methyltransferase